MTRSYQPRATWSAEMVACLLELRLGSLLPRFSNGRAPVHLQDAWNLLQREFAAETGVDVSVQQLKNKYHQLKREYEETKRRLDSATTDGVDVSHDTLSLPLYWDVIDGAFAKSDGLRGVSFFRRGPKTEGAAATPDASPSIAATVAPVAPVASIPAAPTVARSVNHVQTLPVAGSPLRAAPVIVAPAAPIIAASTDPSAAAAAAVAGLRDVSTAAANVARRRSFPTAIATPQPPVREWSTDTTSQRLSNNINSNNINSNNSHKRPLVGADESQPPAKTPKLDVAQALVHVGDALARAMVESARIVAAGLAAGSATRVDELATRVDAQLAQQTQLLQRLEHSLAQSLRK